MTVDPRAALDRFQAALEAHLHAVSTRRSDDDPGGDDAYDVLADAFDVYDAALLERYSETLPFGPLDDEEDDDEDEDAEDADTALDVDDLDGVDLLEDLEEDSDTER